MNLKKNIKINIYENLIKTIDDILILNNKNLFLNKYQIENKKINRLKINKNSLKETSLKDTIKKIIEHENYEEITLETEIFVSQNANNYQFYHKYNKDFIYNFTGKNIFNK